MTSLYNRATPSQARILRAVEGACKNATDAHPELKISPRHRRSIAKRAAGTLTAQWPDVLAARASPGSRSVIVQITRSGRSSDFLEATTRGPSNLSRRSPLRLLEGQIASQLKGLKAAGEHEKVAHWIEVLRMIADLKSTPTQREDNGRK